MSNAVNTADCCDMHNRHCEPPADLCCHDCTEAAHDTFPIRHADGTSCVMEDVADLDREQFDRDVRAALTQLDGTPEAAIAVLTGMPVAEVRALAGEIEDEVNP